MIASTVTPTVSVITQPHAEMLSFDSLRERIAAATRSVISCDAQTLSERLFDDHLPAYILMVGVSVQAGLLPLSVGAIEAAIGELGAATEVTWLRSAGAGRSSTTRRWRPGRPAGRGDAERPGSAALFAEACQPAAGDPQPPRPDRGCRSLARGRPNRISVHGAGRALPGGRELCRGRRAGRRS